MGQRIRAYTKLTGSDLAGNATVESDATEVYWFEQAATYKGGKSFWKRGSGEEMNLDCLYMCLPIDKNAAKIMGMATKTEKVDKVELFLVQDDESSAGKQINYFTIEGEDCRWGSAVLRFGEDEDGDEVPDHVLEVGLYAAKWKWKFEGGTEDDIDLTQLNK